MGIKRTNEILKIILPLWWGGGGHHGKEESVFFSCTGHSLTLMMDRLERILTMVYVVQNYWAYFGLYIPDDG
jgi:hypothetical protein